MDTKKAGKDRAALVNDAADKIDAFFQAKAAGEYFPGAPEHIKIGMGVTLDIPRDDLADAIAIIKIESSLLHVTPSYIKRYAIDAILRAGTHLTQGVPIESSDWQKNSAAEILASNAANGTNNPCCATQRMVDQVRECFAPLVMDAIRNAADVEGRGQVLPLHPVPEEPNAS